MYKNRTILLVEDEAVISIALAHSIKNFGFEVITANNGEMAVKACAENESINFVLMDLDLGAGLQGPEAAAEILKFRDLPVVFLTSHSGQQMVESVIGIPHYGYVIKSSGDFLLKSSIEMALQLFDAHEKVKASEAKFKSIIELAPDAILLGNSVGIIIGANKRSSELSGYSYDELIGENIQILFTEEERNRVPLRYDLLKQKRVERNDRFLKRKDGSTVFIEMNTKMMPDGTYQTLIRDMTEKIKLLDVVQQTDRLNSLGVLAGGIAHDFNNLLSGIFGYIEMARLKSTSDRVVVDYLDKAFGVFDRARGLTQQLLTFSKGGLPVRSTGDIARLIKESALFALSGSNITCEFEIDEDLRLCDFDVNQIAQVIDNIVINAKQAMPLGGKISISVKNFFLEPEAYSILRSGNYIKISIADTGIGIQQEHLKRIFDPFFTTKQQGNGLGLATCYSIIKKHDGLIEANSIPGKGSEFIIYLPASEKEIDNSVYSVSSLLAGAGKILVMDDEDFIRDISMKMLRLLGYSAAEASDGEEALALMAGAEKDGEQFDGVILDLTIPGGMGGRETLVGIRKLYGDIPVFASSGFSEDPIISKPQNYGFTGSIRKPYRKDELAELLGQFLISKS